MELFQAKVNDETKQRTVAAIEAANSYEYRAQVAEHNLVNRVIDDMLNDPFWRDVINEAIEARAQS